MKYTLDSSALNQPGQPFIAIVGCGGTGGFVAEGVCRLLGDRPATLVLVDPDRVEPHNLRRQAFYGHDLGKFKSQVIADRLTRNYGREIAYSVYPYSNDIHRPMFGGAYGGRTGIIIGCVDNPAARKSIADEAEGLWWIDAGNSDNSGQVLIGNTKLDGTSLQASFHEDAGICVRLPMPTVQAPELLMPLPVAVAPPIDCAEAVDLGGQSPVINEVMASLVKQFVHRLLAGTLSWMGLYVDLDLGTLRPVEADPAVVARMTGVPKKNLVTSVGLERRPPCPRCGRLDCRGAA